MVHAKMTKESQSRLWTEVVNTSGFLQDLMCTARNNTPALELWTGEKVAGWFTKLVPFERIGYIPKGGKLKSKLKAKGKPVMMLGYVKDHEKGTYRVYKASTKRVVLNRDVI